MLQTIGGGNKVLTIQTVYGAGGDNEATGIDCNAISSNLRSKISYDSHLQYISTT
jgi:streptomycin 6-kinase